MRTDRTARLLELYYWATPLFLAADALLGVSVRASALPGLDARLGYYAFCLACATLIRLLPDTAAWVGMVESAGNILLLILGIWLPLVGVLDAAASGADAEPAAITPARLLNFAISGFAFYRSFLLNQERARGRLA